MGERRLRVGLVRNLWAVLVGILLGGAGVAAVLATSQGTTSAPGTGHLTPSTCQNASGSVPDPSAVHGLFVLDPPTSPHAPYYADIATDLLPNPSVCGADFWVHWDAIDGGPGADPQYNFTHVDAMLAPWVAAGKTVNLIFWSVGYGPNQTYLPSYLMSKVATVQCAGSPTTPLFWTPAFIGPYQAFMRAVVHHYDSFPGVGYLRFGLGTGGEVFPLVDVSAPGCENRLNATGFSLAVWDQYLLTMLRFERSLNASVQLMVGLNSVIPGSNDNSSELIASEALRDGFGIGSQGLQASAVQLDPFTGAAGCNGGWCKVFDQYEGRLPLELQTLGPSAPNGSGPIGSLPPLLTYGLDEHAQVFELYFDDWLTAFDPSFPAYAAYHGTYATALDQAAAAVG